MRHIDCKEHARNLLPSCLAWFLSDRNLAKVRAETASGRTVRLLAADGLKITDYTAKPVVGAPGRFDCLKSGECAGVPMGQPEDLGAIAQGFPRLAFTNEAVADLIFNVDMARRAWAAQNKDTMVRFVRAMSATYAYMNNPNNRSEIVGIVRDTGKLSDAVAQKIFAPIWKLEKTFCRARARSTVVPSTACWHSWAKSAPFQNPCRRQNDSSTCNT